MCANYDPMAEIACEAFPQFPKPNFDFPIETRLRRADSEEKRRLTPD